MNTVRQSESSLRLCAKRRDVRKQLARDFVHQNPWRITHIPRPHVLPLVKEIEEWRWVKWRLINYANHIVVVHCFRFRLIYYDECRCIRCLNWLSFTSCSVSRGTWVDLDYQIKINSWVMFRSWPSTQVINYQVDSWWFSISWLIELEVNTSPRCRSRRTFNHLHCNGKNKTFDVLYCIGLWALLTLGFVVLFV